MITTNSFLHFTGTPSVTDPELKEKIIQARKRKKDFIDWDPDFRPLYVKYQDPFYRFVGQAEVDKVIKGERIYSPGTNFVNITNDSKYFSTFVGYPYRIKFKENDSFDPAMYFAINHDDTYTTEKNTAFNQYNLHNGYSLDDIQEIKFQDKQGKWSPVYPAPETPKPLTEDRFESSPKPQSTKKNQIMPKNLQDSDTDTSWKKMVLDARKQGTDFFNDSPYFEPTDIRYKGPFYRFIGKSELDKVLAGEHVTSNRPCHHGRVTDVTNKPDYGKVPNTYRIKFKKIEKFDPILTSIEHQGPQTMNKNEKEGEYHLLGGYSIDDIETIEHSKAGEWEQIFPKSQKPSEPILGPSSSIHNPDNQEQLKPPTPPVTDEPTDIPDNSKAEVNPSSTSTKGQASVSTELTKAPDVSQNTRHNWSTLSLAERNKTNWQSTTHKKAFVTCNTLAVLTSIAALALGPLGVFLIPPIAILLAIGLLPSLKALFKKEIGSSSQSRN